MSPSIFDTLFFKYFALSITLNQRKERIKTSSIRTGGTSLPSSCWKTNKYIIFNCTCLSRGRIQQTNWRYYNDLQFRRQLIELFILTCALSEVTYIFPSSTLKHINVLLLTISVFSGKQRKYFEMCDVKCRMWMTYLIMFWRFSTTFSFLYQNDWSWFVLTSWKHRR